MTEAAVEDIVPRIPPKTTRVKDATGLGGVSGRAHGTPKRESHLERGKAPVSRRRGGGNNSKKGLSFGGGSKGEKKGIEVIRSAHMGNDAEKED